VFLSIERACCLPLLQAVSTALFAHQKQALSWMMRAENTDQLPPFWQQRGTCYYNSLTSFSSQTRPRSIRGGTYHHAEASFFLFGKHYHFMYYFYVRLCTFGASHPADFGFMLA